MFTLTRLVKYSLKRFYSNSTQAKYVIEALKERSLIRVTGQDASEFLQGIITNDIRHLENGPSSMFTMFLNTRGRVLYDSIIYRFDQSNILLIECDEEALGPLQKHLKMFRVRRKVDINLDDQYSIYVIYNASGIKSLAERDITLCKSLEGYIVPCDVLNESERTTFCKVYKDLFIYKDPRTSYLGSRIIVKKEVDPIPQVNEIFKVESPSIQETYRKLRYSLGIGEGVKDLPTGNCFPLENNCDYLHGVSFHKGCYIGQELTARTHHTGVIRKRLMPLHFTKIPTNLPVENTVIHEGVNLGKLRGIDANVGLGLLRISKALAFNEINVGNGVAQVRRPSWWPIEAPKEKVNAERAE